MHAHNIFNDLTYLSSQVLRWINGRFLIIFRLDTAASTLYEWSHPLLQRDLYPFHILEVQDKHLIIENSTFCLTTIYYHTLLEHCRTVILSSTSGIACGLALAHLLGVSFKLEKLVRALSNLTLWTEHETSTKDVDSTVKRD